MLPANQFFYKQRYRYYFHLGISENICFALNLTHIPTFNKKI